MSMFSDMAYEHVEQICKELKDRYDKDDKLSSVEREAMKRALDELISKLPY